MALNIHRSIHWPRLFGVTVLSLFVLAFYAFGHIGRQESTSMRLQSTSTENVGIHSANASDGQLRSRVNCSNENFQRYYERHDGLPGEGRWDRWDHFHPRLCRLHNNTIPPDHLHRCFRKKQIKHIMTIGNSNAARFYLSLIDQLAPGYSNCYQTHVANHSDDDSAKAYYTRANNELNNVLKAEKIRCRTCYSRTTQCESAHGDLKLEHLGMVLMWDRSLTAGDDSKTVKAKSTQEFLFRYYLTHNSPDLLLLMPPAALTKQAENFAEQISGIARVNNLIKKYLPNTLVYWISGFAEVDERKPEYYKNRRYGGLLSTERIEELNRAMFKVLKTQLIDNSSRTRSFLISFPCPSLKPSGAQMVFIWTAKITNGTILLSNIGYKRYVMVNDSPNICYLYAGKYASA